MFGRDHQLELRRNSDLAFDVEHGTGRRYVADPAIDCCPVECDRGAFRDALAPAGPLFAHGGFGPADLSIGFVARRGAGFCRMKAKYRFRIAIPGAQSAAMMWVNSIR
jgi:hypothetical protein